MTFTWNPAASKWIHIWTQIKVNLSLISTLKKEVYFNESLETKCDEIARGRFSNHTHLETGIWSLRLGVRQQTIARTAFIATRHKITCWMNQGLLRVTCFSWIDRVRLSSCHQSSLESSKYTMRFRKWPLQWFTTFFSNFAGRKSCVFQILID